MSGNKHNYKRRLDHYKLVNKCETYGELAVTILEIAKDNNGIINGRTRSFDAAEMAQYALDFDKCDPRLLTRNYGIRQQALYIKDYNQRYLNNETRKIN